MAIPQDPTHAEDGRESPPPPVTVFATSEEPSASESSTQDRKMRPAFEPSARMRQAFADKDTAMATSEARAEELLAFSKERTSWRVYRTLCRIRFGYLSFLTLMVVLMFSFTMLMEIFFAIFLPSARTFSTEYIVRSVILLALLPVMLFFVSYFFEETSRFFFDAISKDDGGLPNFRLAVAVVIHYVRNRSEIKAKAAAEATARRESLREEQGELPRKSFLISAEDDPFVDGEDEEEEVAETKEEISEWEQAQEEALEEGVVNSSPARRRWKRVGGAVMASTLLQKTHFEGTYIGLSTFLVVDFLCPVLFEIFTALMCLFELLDSWSPYSAFLTYVRNGFYLVSFYVILWMACHFWSSRNPHMRSLVSHYRRKRRNLHREVRSVQQEKQAEQLWLLDVGFRFYHHVGVFINPLAWIRRRSSGPSADTTNTALRDADDQGLAAAGLNETTAATYGSTSQVATRLQNIRDARARFRGKNPWRRLSYGKQMIILSVICVLTALVSLWSFMVGWPLMGIALIMLSNVTQRRFPQIFGNTFRHFITAFVVLSLFFFSSTVIIGTFVQGGSFVLGGATNATDVASLQTVTPVSLTIEYPVCSVEYDGLSVLDLALLADAAYGSTPDIQQASLRNRFNGTDLEDWKFVDHNTASEHQVWMEIFFPSINMTVIAVRGTASAADALEDLHYWFGILVMQAVNVFIPFLKQLPRDFVVNLLSMKSMASLMPPPVFDPLVDHAVAVKARVGDKLVITGHSLGGAMAAMLGAKVKAQAVSLSGPGLLYSRGRFDVEAQDVRDYVLTLKPKRDIVPQVDELGGLVQELRCRHKSPMSCHSSTTHLCELYLACGDSRQRNWDQNQECNAYRALPVIESTP